MTGSIETMAFILAVLVLVAVIAQRLTLPPSILLVMAGIGLALVPGLPALELAPELVILVLLPPLIYSAGVAMSWREFCQNLRPITLLAFGAVVFTTVAVAAAMHYLLHWPWPVAFVLGAIVSPPDVVAPLSIARRLGLPRRLLVVLEGEGLANDATALILYKFAVLAVTAGSISAGKAAGNFALIVAGEVLYGIGVGWLSLRLRHWAREPRVEITLSVMTPFLAYLIPHQVGGSGVLATVACGLYVSWNGPRLISAATRLQGIFFWDLIIYLIEGFVFLITGLQARSLIEKAHDFPIGQVLTATAVTVVIVILARFAWVFPVTYGTRWLNPVLARREPSPPWRWVFVLSFVGIRGVVSLAAALAIPLWVDGGNPFPHRDLILFATFGVIIVTLIGQGLMLPNVIRWLGLRGDGEADARLERQAELDARTAAVSHARTHLKRIAEERGLSEEIVTFLNARHDQRERLIPSDLDDGLTAMRANNDVRLELISAERDFLYGLLRGGTITDESRRRLERELDLEEAAILAKREGETPL
ncbi:Na+/H+ antiporter [Rhodoplanes sp. Z2-YC6860]|uniref:Na+/H+ antiporter n=1 Tax=Rhodoplanes sp. Z2-YC6860 TaxID=674703 RepID=UPI00078CDCDE|nr:Na+/H+ antiporter [Rhodoplanes sp. Z2-YC6860]AMN45355.1 Na(+)/H(+) exchanger [Rhodoplanes sp. Z2-YC6860]